MGLSGFWILFSILIAGELWGITGMLIGAPLFAVIYDLIRTFILDRLRKRREDGLIDAYEAQFGEQAEK
jgi:predicted PurR-regulated permease PerM